MKVRNPLLIAIPITILLLMIFCFYSSLKLFTQSADVEQIRPSDGNLMLASLAGVQETMLGLLTTTAFLSLIGPLFSLYVERTLADKLLTWKERPREGLIAILVFQPVMLFLLNSPSGQISRAVALVLYNPQESISSASIVKTYALTFVPIWALIITLFVFSYLKIVKEL